MLVEASLELLAALAKAGRVSGQQEVVSGLAAAAVPPALALLAAHDCGDDAAPHATQLLIELVGGG